MKNIFLSAILIMTAALSYSQTMLVDIPFKDTTTAYPVSINDIRLYNHATADLDACNELADSLYAEIQNNELSRKQKDEAIIIYNGMISNLENQVKEKEITEGSYKKEAKINSNKTKFFKGLLYIVSSVAIGELIFIGVTRD